MSDIHDLSLEEIMQRDGVSHTAFTLRLIQINFLDVLDEL